MVVIFQLGVIRCMSHSGKLTIDDLRALISSSEIETVLVAFTDLYGRLMGKRFDAQFFLTTVAENGTHGCDYLLTVDMEMEPVTGYKFANWTSGYGDMHLVPDLSTLRLADWLDKTAIVLCDIFDNSSHELVPLAPRSLLKRQIERCAKFGFTAKSASELEYYIFRNSYQEASESEYRNLNAASWYLEDYHVMQGAREEDLNATVRRHLSRSGIPIESTKGEWGLGQHELNVQYCDVLEMADRHVLLKQCLKETADQQQISVTFMGKFAEDQAGSSCHLHLSLWRDGINAFSDNTNSVEPTEIFNWFLAGWINQTKEFMPFYAPNVNSYKRYQSGSWAPTRLAWSQDNRTAGFRVVGSGPSLRIECRVPGADCNPYLTYSAALASGLHGIDNRITPPPVFEGDAYTAHHFPHVSTSLCSATDLFEQSDFVQATLGEDVHRHYTHFFRTEQSAFDGAVTDWERRRYFERI